MQSLMFKEGNSNMQIAQNQVLISLGDESRLYTFNQSGHCDVTNAAGQWVGGGLSDMGLSNAYCFVTDHGYSIDAQSLENFMQASPELGERLQMHLYRSGALV